MFNALSVQVTGIICEQTALEYGSVSKMWLPVVTLNRIMIKGPNR